VRVKTCQVRVNCEVSQVTALKPISASILLCTALVLGQAPAFAKSQSVTHTQKQGQKAEKKANKKQAKAEKKQMKEQSKASKKWNKQHPRVTTT